MPGPQTDRQALAPSIDALVDFVRAHPDLVVISGAGCSAPSGIPTYRNRDADWQRSTPIQHQDFISRIESQQRYWARSFAGWPAVRDAIPNAAHQGLAALESLGYTSLLVTQNVDRLHQKAGQREVIDLHGRLDRVVCLGCDAQLEREQVQRELAQLNPAREVTRTSITPDGDAEIEGDTTSLKIPACPTCGGVLKPDVVFFGGSVAKPVVQRVYAAIEKASGLLVVGSSLMVFSGFRFCRAAAAAGKPIAIINDGKTRADDLSTLKLSQPCEVLIPALLERLDPNVSGQASIAP